jgi:hypothetical protein
MVCALPSSSHCHSFARWRKGEGLRPNAETERRKVRPTWSDHGRGNEPGVHLVYISRSGVLRPPRLVFGRFRAKRRGTDDIFEQSEPSAQAELPSLVMKGSPVRVRASA